MRSSDPLNDAEEGPDATPLFPPGVEGLAKDLLAPTREEAPPTQVTPPVPATDQATMPIGALAAQSTVPATPRGTAGRPKLPPRLGPYLLGAELGHGGMGYVFRARHEKLGTDCAVKVLIAGEHASPELIARFQREAGAVAKMGKHPNIVSVFDLGEEAGLAYYAMELVEGRSLRAEMKAREIQSREAAVIAEKTARALHFAHDHGIIHRDMKPDNIIMRKDGEPQVLDFGLARDAGSEQHLSVTGQIMGTLAYMAPEQAAGRLDAMDARTDVYALGGVLYELLTGSPPHPGKTFAAALPMILRGDIIPPRRLRLEAPRDLETVAMKALALEPSRRYASAEAMAEDLARWSHGYPILARPIGPAARLVRRVRRHPVLSALVATVVAAVSWAAWSTIGPAWVTIPTDPPDARVTVNGRSLRRSGLVWPAGTLTVRVEASGRVPDARTLEAPAGRRTTFARVSLPLDHGFLTVDSAPQEAEVWIDERDTGARTPAIDLSTPNGQHVLGLRAAGHDELVTSVRIEPDAHLDVKTHYLVHQKGTLSLTAWPSGVSVQVSEAVSGRVVARLTPPIEYPIDTGEFVLEATLADHFRRKYHAQVDVGKAARVHVSLPPQVLWGVAADAFSFGVLRVGDLDQDGEADTIVCGNDGRLRAISGADRTLLWDHDRSALSCGVAVLGDLDRDGVLDVVSGTQKGEVFALSGRDGRALWTRSAGTISAPQCVGDLDEDGVPDGLFAFDDNEGLRALSGKDGSELWRFATGDPRRPCASVADLDGDGHLEVLVGSYDSHVYALQGSDARLLWRFAAGFCVTDAPTACDLDRDGVLDAAFGCCDGRVYVVSGKKGTEIWSFPTGGEVIHPPALTDLDGDGVPDAVFGSSDRHAYAVSGATGRPLWKSAELPGSIDHTVALALIDDDATPDAIIGGGQWGMFAVSGKDGAQLWHLDSPNVPISQGPSIIDRWGDQECLTSGMDGRVLGLAVRDGACPWGRDLPVTGGPELADIDGDGLQDVLVGGGDNRLHALSGKGGQVLWAGQAGAPVLALPSVGDLDADGISDCVVGGGYVVHAFSGGDGHELWARKTGNNVYTAGVLRDIDGDGSIDVLIGSGDGTLYALRGRDGHDLWTYSAPGSSALSFSRPVVGDMDGDGVSEIAVGLANGTVQTLSLRDGGKRWCVKLIEGDWPSVAMADLNGDGREDCVASVPHKGLFALSGVDGARLWDDVHMDCIVYALALADLDRDGTQDLVAVDVEGEVHALSGTNGASLWSARLGRGPFLTPRMADIDGDGVADCLIAAGEGGIHLLSGKDGAPLWHAETGAQMCPAFGDIDGDGRPEVVVAEKAGGVRVLRLPRAFPPPPLARLRQMRLWPVLARRADEEAHSARDPWVRAVALVERGLALSRLGSPAEALDAFADARGLGLRSPEAAVAEGVIAATWAGCAPDRRDVALRTLAEALSTRPDLVFDALVGESEAATIGLTQWQALLQTEAADEDGRSIAALALCVLAKDAEAKEALRSLRGRLATRLASGGTDPARGIGYLALAAQALGEEAEFGRLRASYASQARRPASIDAILGRMAK